MLLLKDGAQERKSRMAGPAGMPCGAIVRGMMDSTRQRIIRLSESGERAGSS